MQLIHNMEKPAAQAYVEKKCQNPELEWKDIHIYIYIYINFVCQVLMSRYIYKTLRNL